MKREQAYFYQVYKGLAMGFGMCEAAFMAYMADLDRLRMSGADTLSGLSVHLGVTGMGRRVFERCTRKALRMGLLEKVPVDGRYDYVWNGAAYNRLVEIVSSNASYVVLREFCDRVFEAEGREVSSITDSEVRALKDTPFPTSGKRQ